MPNFMPPQGMAPQGPQPFFQQVGGDTPPVNPSMMDEVNKLADMFGSGAGDVRMGLYDWVLEQRASLEGPDSPAAKELEIRRATEQKRKSMESPQ